VALIRLTIDGKQTYVEKETTVLEAARLVGVEIPALCHHPDLPPNAACRLCLVEIEGQGTLQASCTLHVADGMVVYTNTPKVQRVRRLMLELLLSEHPRDCMTCEQAGKCELQDVAYKLGVEESRFTGKIQHYEWIDDSNPFIVRDYDKCIACWRCTAACAEVQGRFAIAKGYRGFEAHPVAGLDVAYDNSICEFCGQCVAYCPTGAVNGMALCVKGRFGCDFVHHPDRLTKPLIRQGDTFVEVSWDEALDLIASRLGKIKEESGPDSIAVLCSAKCTNEENYVAQKFTRAVLGTNNIDHCARL